MALMKAISHVREMHDSMAKDLGYSYFIKMHSIVELGHGILPHFLLGMVKAIVMSAYPVCLIMHYCICSDCYMVTFVYHVSPNAKNHRYTISYLM